MPDWMRFVLRYLVATLLCFTLASIAHSQMVLWGLQQQAIVIPPFERLQMTLSDWWGLLPTYGSVIAVGLLIALLVATWLSRKTGPWGGLVFGLAGAVALLSILLAMQPIMDITLIAGARSHMGLLLQVSAGFIGGLVFYWLRKKPKRHFD